MSQLNIAKVKYSGLKSTDEVCCCCTPCCQDVKRNCTICQKIKSNVVDQQRAKNFSTLIGFVASSHRWDCCVKIKN